MWRRLFGRPERRASEGGFTLIEMMATAVILGTLSSIALPKFADLIESANERNDKQILRRIRLGIQMYYDDNDYFPPDISATESAGGPGPHAIKDYFQPYFDTGDHKFPRPKSNLGASTPSWGRGTVFDWNNTLTNSNYNSISGANFEEFGYNNKTGAFILDTLFRDKSPYRVDTADTNVPAGPGIPKCWWASDRDPGRDAR